MSLKKFEPEDTMTISWIDSGVSLDSSSWMIIDGNETILESGSLTSSGNGHYYNRYTIPASFDGYYVARIVCSVGGTPYRRSTRFRVIGSEVD